jgi:1,4-dihydroxy-2-naphthoate polyprenyltransferase
LEVSRGVPPRLWVEAARPRTLVAGIVPVLVGTAASGTFSLPRFLGALVVAVFMQIAVNFANDLFDAVKGVDTAQRLGPRRLTAAGLISPKAMRNAIVASFLVAILAGLGLAAVAGWVLVIVGAISVLAALGYSGGPFPYGSRGLGEVFVFIFFGVVATVGSAYVQIEQVTPLAIAASVPVGFLAAAILVVNNLRDIETDAPTGKRTLAVMLGVGRTQLLYRALLLGSYLSLAGVAAAGGGPQAFLPLLSLPLAVKPLKLVTIAQGPGLIAVLVATAKLQLAFGVLLAVGLWI